MKTNELDYLYRSAQAAVLSRTLLPWETVIHMAEAESAEEALALLDEQNGDLEAEKAKLFALLTMGGRREPVVALFQYPYDCHNAKVLLRRALTGQEGRELLSPCGSVAAEKLEEAVNGAGGVHLPAWLREGLADARRVWTDSRSLQLLDAALDRACVRGQLKAAEESGCDAARTYVKCTIDGINLQTLLRRKEVRMEAMEELLLPGGTVSPARLLEGRAAGDLQAVYSGAFRAAAESGDPRAAAQALRSAQSALAARCRMVPYGQEVLLGACLQLELRQSAVRFVLAEQRHDRGKGLKEQLEVRYG